MKMLELKGIPELLERLSKAKNQIADRAGVGLTYAGLFLQRESMKMVPVQTGNLKDTAFTRRFGSGLSTDVVVGFTAEYAVYVHEDLTKAHGRKFNEKHRDEILNASSRARTAEGGMFNRGENQQAKYLERPAREKRKEMLRIVAVYAGI